MGVKAAKKKKKRKFRLIIKEFRVSTQSEAAQCKGYKFFASTFKQLL